jgi:hypothetical protein
MILPLLAWGALDTVPQTTFRDIPFTCEPLIVQCEG